MLFFYLGIGFAMLTSALGIFRTSTTISKNQYPIHNNSIDSDKVIMQKQNDIKFLQILNDLKGKSLGSGDLICKNLKNGFSDELNENHFILSKYPILKTYNSGIPSYSSHKKLKDGCDLVNDFHRVVIVPSSTENNTYDLYSCIIDFDPKCPFEIAN